MPPDSPDIYSGDRFALPLPAGHRFPEEKYAMLRLAVEEAGWPVLDPPAATRAELARVHHASYLDALEEGRLSREQLLAIGFPWSKEMVERSKRSTGATLAAARAALRDGLGIHLAGGTHHAMPEGGEGFCTYNDAAVALHTLLAEGLIVRAAIVDLDVHQGNGNAVIFHGDPRVATLSLHGATNYPFEKASSDLDIALPEGCGDSEYLAALEGCLPEFLDRAAPELVLAICGADVWEHDRLGRLGLSAAGIEARDRSLFGALAARRGPVCMVMGGGYGDPIEGTVEIQRRCVELALEYLWAPDPSPTHPAR